MRKSRTVAIFCFVAWLVPSGSASVPMTPLLVACSPVEMSDAKAELLYHVDLRRAKARH